ncbi:ankyrin-3 [Rhodamnia argentea]|uniref:Ankyrin-3 n=1 Tax=Rhodamnia argentea TaxID=178133 RepID=A0A8B8PMJ4_9MYRT|nr:ankyrin-3 [Rhodamnia argentea]
MGKHPSSASSRSGEDLHAAARSGDLRAVLSILAANPLAVNSRDKHSRTPLHLAAWSGQAQVVTYLCQNKADVGAAAMDDMGAIHFAAQKGHLEVVRTLLSSGVSVKAANRKGFTPLHYAVQGSHLELVKYLVKKGASLSTKTKAGKTPVDLASSEEIRSFLVESEESSKKGEHPDPGKQAEASSTNLSSHEKSENSHEMSRNSEEEDENAKRKGNDEEIREASQPKKAKVALNHLTSADDAQDDEENF